MAEHRRSVDRPGRQPNSQCFTGSPEQVAEDIREFEAAGVTDLILRFPGTTQHEETLASLDRFAEEVMAKL